jgi:exodeoxyribonuclease V beta subunit
MEITQHPIELIDFNLNNQAFVIEASAGTGKTWTIERLFVKAILSKTHFELKNFLVITFTKDATSELKQRILNFIHQTITNLIVLNQQSPSHSNDPFIKQILQLNLGVNKCISILNSTLQNFDQASIYTIHGLYHRILTQYQFEIDVMANFKLTEYKPSLIAELTRNFFRSQIFNRPDIINNLDNVYNNLDQIIRNGNMPSNDYITTLTNILYRDKLINYQNNHFELSYTVIKQPELSLLTHKTIKTSKKSTKKKNNDGDGEQISINQIQLHLLSALAIYISNNFNQYLTNKNTIDFNDIVAILADELANNHKLSDELCNDYPVVFIDEFQDTDILQWNILCNIYQLNRPNRRGFMVAVGDPKQAIYKFRGADINAYMHAKTIINNTLTLNENRRSHPNIVNFINQLFANNHAQQCFGPAIKFNFTHAMAAAATLKLPTVSELNRLLDNKNLPPTNLSDTNVQIVSITAQDVPHRNRQVLKALAYEILLLLNHNSQLVNSMAILVTTNDEAFQVKKVLSQYGIKLTVYKKENIFATSTAEDLLTIFNALVNLANQQKLKLTLATNLFNIPYTDLNNFIKLSQQIFTNHDIVACLVKYKQTLLNSSHPKILALIYLLIDDLNKIYQFYQTKLKDQTVANLIQLGELIQAKCKHMSSLHEIIFWLKQKIDNTINNRQNSELSDDELEKELVRLDTHETQIPIITQHKSKGLEFEIVFCPFFKGNVYSISDLKKIASNDVANIASKPQFISYFDNNNTQQHLLTPDITKIIATKLDNNLETQRLNYVSLTRAKTRLYIYLSNITKRNDKEWWSSVRPPILYQLFGFNPLVVDDNNHPLFNYHNLFDNPQLAIKQPELLSGVSVYSRNDIDNNMLMRLKINSEQARTAANNPSLPGLKTALSPIKPTFIRQSYSSLTRITSANPQNILDKLSEINNVEPQQQLSYSYSILNQLKGAEFGILVHSLCEKYPLDLQQINQLNNHPLLSNYSTDIRKQYISELISIIDKIFNYPILNNYSLNTLNHKTHELEFNLKVNQPVSLNQQIKALFDEYYGADHPYSLECDKLDIIKSGFLHGFIDVLFACDNKYYILDYKTNSLTNYQSCLNPLNEANNIVNDSAKNLYHIQYVLYLVAVKRYLQQKLGMADATGLLGGAIYFYVRGLFVKDTPASGVLIDEQCIKLVARLEQMF